jgi:hypothetical protein
VCPTWPFQNGTGAGLGMRNASAATIGLLSFVSKVARSGDMFEEVPVSMTGERAVDGNCTVRPARVVNQPAGRKTVMSSSERPGKVVQSTNEA